jgi:DNA-binding transcriptional MocR family regulator
VNSGPISERVYDAIKRRILSRVYRPGERLDPALLAQTVSSSITPVRDALNLLTGQGLVETGTSEGFHLPHIDEPALKDLYAWNLEILALSIRSWPRDGHPYSCIDEDGNGSNLVDSIAAVGNGIARRSTNAEHSRAVGSLNDRLAAIRIVEPSVMEVDHEIEIIDAALQGNDDHGLRRLLLDYHRRRQRKAAEIVRAYYRA